MKSPYLAVILLLLLQAGFCLGHAEDLLFFGNSLTYGEGGQGIKKNGGVPWLVKEIAAAKGKAVETTMLAVGRKDWGFHLGRPQTTQALTSKKWTWVVLQDFSNQATHVGHLNAFLKNGETFYTLIAQKAPTAHILLYQTWPYAPGHGAYTGTSSSDSFVDYQEMSGELAKNYETLFSRLKARDPDRLVKVAPVGTAFTHCLQEFPEIQLYSADKKHASPYGYYLAALVIYSTIYQDSPKGAPSQLGGATFDASASAKLQSVASEVMGLE